MGSNDRTVKVNSLTTIADDSLSIGTLGLHTVADSDGSVGGLWGVRPQACLGHVLSMNKVHYG